jgi:enterochelin esterase-like enzyme
MRFAALILTSSIVLAQQTLQPGKPITGEIAAGVSKGFVAQFSAGDYVTATITRRGKIDIEVRRPDGSSLRRFRSPAADGKRQFGFVAEPGGRYGIDLANPSESSARFEISLDAITSLAERLKPAPDTDAFASNVIEGLRKQVAAGNSSTDRFWVEVTSKGTPLIEPSGSDGKYQLITFLWRGTPTTSNVVVLGPNWGSQHHTDNSMHRIGGTDVWYLTKRLPSGARFEYRLSLNDPLTSDSLASAIRRVTAQADPLNPNDWECSAGSPKHECYSAVELPGAVPQPWFVKQPGKPTGNVEHHDVRSDIQKLDRSIAIYTPPGYRRGGPPNDLLFLFDGPAYLSPGNAMPITMDNLIAAAKIPPTVAVLVSNVGDRRLTDLVPNPEFADFMAKELVPWVRSRYHVTSDPGRTVVGGFSAGGLAAAYMGLRHSSVFGNVLSQSGAFWWAPDHYQNANSTTETNWMVKQYLASPKLPVRFYLEAGTFEMDQAGEGGDILEATRHLRDVLLAKGYVARYQQFVGGHDGLSWRGTLADGLIALLGSK